MGAELGKEDAEVGGRVEVGRIGGREIVVDWGKGIV